MGVPPLPYELAPAFQVSLAVDRDRCFMILPSDISSVPVPPTTLLIRAPHDGLASPLGLAGLVTGDAAKGGRIRRQMKVRMAWRMFPAGTAVNQATNLVGSRPLSPFGPGLILLPGRHLAPVMSSGSQRGALVPVQKRRAALASWILGSR